MNYLLFTSATICTLFHAALHAAEVFNQNFSSSASVTSYYSSSSPQTGQFNDINAETSGGTWSVNNGALQLIRQGNANGAGITRFTDFTTAPSVLHLKFDFAVSINSYQNDLLVLDIGKFSELSDYNNSSIAADVFARLNIDGLGSNAFAFETGGVRSASYVANGSFTSLELFLNKSGAPQSYLAPNGSVKNVDPNRQSLWAGSTCLFDNVSALAGSGSTLTDLRIRLATADQGTWKLDNFVLNNSFPISGAPGKIQLTPAMVINEGAQGDAGMLVDEQTQAGDPASGSTAAMVTKFNPGSAWYYPANAVIDLGCNHELTKISFYDSNGTGNVTFSRGVPFGWVTLATDGQNLYNQWKTISLPANTQTRYVQVSIASASAVPNEVVLYGRSLGTPAPVPAAVPHIPPPFDQFVGANAFIDDPLGRLEAVGYIREYHNWSWDEGNGSAYPGFPANQNAFNPSYSGWWNFDAYYLNLSKLNILCVPAIKQNVSWLGMLDSELKPILANSGRSAESSASYIEHGDHLYQYAARYGSSMVADSLLKLAAGQPRVSGLGTVQFYENWNEQDKWWKTRDGYFSPFEYAAMSSADYDGHQGTMGNTVGVKNASATAKLVMSGTAMPNLEYIKAIKLWADFKRAGSFPLDVINVHHYSNDAGGQGGTPTIGISPEADNLKGKMQLIREYRDRYLPGREFWVSEFGYDTHPASTQRAPAIGSYSAQEVQGQWLVRSFLALAAAGVDRAAMYMSRDALDNDATRYNTSGLTSSKATGFVPKVSWFYVYTLKNRLKGLRFGGEQASGNSNVTIHQYKDNDGVIKAYVMWCPTSNQTSVSNYQLTLSGTPASAKLVTLQTNDIDGVSSPLAIEGGKVTVNVSERPLFVLVDHTLSDVQPDVQMTLSPAMIVNETGKGNAALLVDEQSAVGAPDLGAGSVVSSVWNPGFQAADHPASCYIDLGQSYDVTKVYILDANAAGDFIISTGSPGNWTVLATDKCPRYNAWSGFVANVNTRYIRVTRAASGSNVAEVVVYRRP